VKTVPLPKVREVTNGRRYILFDLRRTTQAVGLLMHEFPALVTIGCTMLSSCGHLCRSDADINPIGMTVPTPVWWTWLACVQSNLHPVHHDRPTRPELVPSRPVVRPCNRSTAVSAHATGDFITSSDIALYNGGVDKTALVMGDCDRYAVGTCRRPPTDRPMS